MLKKVSLSDIISATSYQGGGECYRLLSLADDSKTGITEITVIIIKKGRKLMSCMSYTMERYLWVMKGRIEVSFQDGNITMEIDDFLRIPVRTEYAMEALDDAKILYVECVIE